MFAPVAELIPHRAPMCWIDSLINCTDTTTTATACFTTDHFAVENGAVTETALVECVAHTVGAAFGKLHRGSAKTGAANIGLLAAVSNFKILTRPPLDQTVTIAIRELKRLGPMLMISGTISCAGQTIATGELSLYV